jgi:hypothetical protein
MDIKRAVTSGALVVLLGVLCIAGSVRAHSSAEASGASAERHLAGETLPLLQYQGRLTDPDTGEPVPDDSLTMTFRLYDAESGGSPLWTELKDVSVQGGVFSTALGDTTALDPSLFDGQALWLGIKVGTDNEATPRQRILPVAYALSLVPGAQISTSSGSAALRVGNAGGGDALQVDGATTLDGDLSVSGSLSGGSHAHSGDDITSGTVAEARIDASIARDSEIMPTVLDNDGTGSGLDADQLDGHQASAFAGAVHNHSGQDITSGTVAEARIDASIARDSEIVPAVLDNDGTGSGLDADQLDGQHASAFAGASHDHTGQDITSGTVAEARIAASIARDSEIVPTVLANDGAGSGLDADRLDGQHASAFAGASHDHLGETWTGSDNPLKIAGSFGSPDYAPLVLSNSHGSGDGLRVSSAADDGIQVESAADDGVFVNAAGEDGVLVTSPGRDGVSVVDPASDGFYVNNAGDDGLGVVSAVDNGVQIDYAGGHGVHVSWAGGDGVRVDGAGLNGVEIWNATWDGVQVNSAGRYGVQANTDGTYGFYTPDKIYAGNGYVDIAEHIDATGDVEPGDVVVIDPDRDEHVVRSARPYDAAVAGIISTDPAMVIGNSETETPLALAGRVPCKVSAENGPIHRGDLLTTSSTPGHAMKATEPMPGTILGKAMGELASGTGVIPVLVTLQ